MAFVSRGDFGFASGHTEDSEFQRLWYAEPLRAAEVSFDADGFLLPKARAEALKERPPGPNSASTRNFAGHGSRAGTGSETGTEASTDA